ncbi:MAG: ammonium transporter [Dehalococcoidia bacterium]|nr:ammonium transporter [Dehalococcoidia bacterium]
MSADAVSSGDTAWVLISSALVMLMTPGLAFFYGGLVRNKNVLGTIMHSFIVIALVSVIWVVAGYSLAFSPGHGFIGGLDWLGLKGVGQEPNPDYSSTVPHMAFMIFQGMFAIITPALITGAFAERAKFSSFLIFMGLWSLLVYAPVAHWVWAPDGWLREKGALDFAGGTVVHVNAGAAALAAALLYGRRIGFGREAMEPHDISMVVLGAALLWFGWFGFNAGSAIASGGLATNAFVVTHVSTAAAALTWTVLSWLFLKKPSVVGAAAGAVAGLVAITPAAGYVDAMPALVIGAGAGLLCFFAVRLRGRMMLDDSLDVVGVHGAGGVWGALATGMFASLAVNAAGSDGLIAGNLSLVGTQALAIAVTAAFSFVATAVILKVLDVTMGLRVSEEEELMGLDATQHGERAYAFEGFGAVPVQEAAVQPRSGPRRLSLEEADMT